jgi:peptidoglycan/xylan/chitin deacetylase (PgdA/CDA1 family)
MGTQEMTRLRGDRGINQRYAVLSMDVEDWFHLDYFRDIRTDRSYSLLDGLDRYANLLQEMDVHSSFFVLSESVSQSLSLLRELAAQGHDIGSHGDDHTRPLTLTVEDFSQRTADARRRLEDQLRVPVEGYRAPCFSLDRERLDAVLRAGFLYDSSKIAFSDHPLYGDLDVGDFRTVIPNVYCLGDFFEFEVSTLPIAGRRLPVSGGGYLRMFPWWFMKRLVSRYLRDASLYVLYIHPFELSLRPAPTFEPEVSRLKRVRFSLGRSSAEVRLRRLIMLLKEYGFRFITFAELCKQLSEVPENALGEE